MEVLNLKKGIYKLNDEVSAFLNADLSILHGARYLLRGENGIGKSSFIKSILIPPLIKAASNNFLFFYAEQEFSLQFHVIQSFYKGLKKIKEGFDTYQEALMSLKREYSNFNFYKDKRIVFVLDEIDQYVGLNKFLSSFDIIDPTIILTTHDINYQLDQKGTVLNFTKGSTDGLQIIIDVLNETAY